MNEQTEKIETDDLIETQELNIEDDFKGMSELAAQQLAEDNFIFCDFEDSEPVVVKLGDLEVFRAYSYHGLFENLVALNEKAPNSTVTLYLVDDELQEEEAFLKIKLGKKSKH